MALYMYQYQRDIVWTSSLQCEIIVKGCACIAWSSPRLRCSLVHVQRSSVHGTDNVKLTALLEDIIRTDCGKKAAGRLREDVQNSRGRNRQLQRLPLTLGRYPMSRPERQDIDT